MRTLLNAIAVIIIIVHCSLSATAQQTNSTAQTKEAADEALREKAFDLLESLAGQLSTLQSTENRARIGSNIAESIWNRDEKRARQLFALVQDDIKSGMNPPAEYNLINYRTFLVFLKLRADTIERIARHDPELAYAFFKGTELDANAKVRYEFRNKERELELYLAKKVASSSPDLALELGRKAIARGFSQDLRVLLNQLNQKHKEEALVLYKEIVQKLSKADFAEDWEARNFALTLALTFPTPEESAFRELINIFIKAGVANGCTKKTSAEDQYHENVCPVIGRVLQHIAKIDPDRAAQLKRWEPGREQYSEEGYISNPAYYELNDIAEAGTVDEILSLAPRHPELAVSIYWQAAMKARADGDFERARKIISDYTGDAEKRRVMLARLDEDQARLAVSEERLSEILKRISEVQEPLARVSMLLALANNAGTTDHKMALKLLNQASEIVKTMNPGREQDEAQIRLAFLYCLEKSDRGMAIMESLVPKLNEFVAAAIKLDSYDTQYVREGEWNMSGEGSLGSLLTLLSSGSGYFAWYDFDRAVSLAGQFERNEIRMMAQLKLAQSILSGPPKRLQFGYRGW